MVQEKNPIFAGGREGWNQIKRCYNREMAPPGSGKMAEAHAMMSHMPIQAPPPCKEDSQSQCSVHKSPMMPLSPWETKAVKHSRLQYVWIPLRGRSWDETPEEKISILKILWDFGEHSKPILILLLLLKHQHQLYGTETGRMTLKVLWNKIQKCSHWEKDTFGLVIKMIHSTKQQYGDRRMNYSPSQGKM